MKFPAGRIPISSIWFVPQLVTTAQCTLYYYPQPQHLFLFSFFFLPSTFLNKPRVHAAEEEVEIQDETCCVLQSCVTFCQHDKVQQSEEWKSPSLGLSVSGLYGPEMNSNRYTKALLDCIYGGAFWKKHSLTTQFSASQLCWSHCMHAAQHRHKFH